MDDIVLENFCGSVKSLIFTKGELVTRGRPGDGVKSCCMLGPGNFSGDELLSRCLRRPFRKTFFYSY
uniref:Cyclic nucleotide-binding domain-containing protein n=2 Tax=Populus TaxID=3689 RepID=A0A2K1YJD3_POPTR